MRVTSSCWTAAASVVLAALLQACAPVRRAPLPAVALASSTVPCTTEVEEANVRNWRQVNDAGAVFCVPSTWKFDDRFERLQSYRTGPAFRARSWVAPDSSERVILEVPADGYSRNALLNTVVNCTRNEVVVQPAFREAVAPTTTTIIGDQPVCVTYRTAGNRSDADVTATFGQPLVRFKVFGRDDARAVLLTVRPAPDGNSQ